ncbi:MAG: prepilin-type N-terminal cleavage/methylation domain-containing protein [Planctomycetes bacterium]|nr:prepilin-type N-terminal cleavage/methylation domain-containing protein [Planctomycetota bacterium]
MKIGNPRARASAPGMTLIELLVAFVILLMLIAALVTLTTRSLETWTQGEARKDMYDRAQVVLDLVSADLRNMYAENEWFTNGMQPLPAPALQADLDKNNRPRIRFVRDGNPALMRAPVGQPATIIAPNYYGPTWEVAYVLDPDPEVNVLHRGLRGFDRRKSGTLLNPVEYSSKTDQLFTSSFTQVETGILHLDYKFWTQYTTTWDDSAAIQKNQGNRSKVQSGPEKRWDSTRRSDPAFHFYRSRTDLRNPDFVYPEIIQISVTVEIGSPDLHGVKVAEPVDERSTYIHLSHTRSMPDGPSMVKIGGEWIEYREKTTNDLVTLRRGQRNTKPASHAIGAPVHFGETFTTDVKLPVFREAQDP